MADPVDEYAVHQFKESDGTKMNPTTKEGLDLGDEDEKKTLEELKAKLEPLTELMKEVLGDKVEEAIVDDRTVDFLRVLTTSGHELSVNMKRIMKTQAPVDNANMSTNAFDRLEQQQHSSKQQQQPQMARQPTQQESEKERGERKKERKEKEEREAEGRKR